MKKIPGATAIIGFALVCPLLGMREARANEICLYLDPLATGIDDGPIVTCAVDFNIGGTNQAVANGLLFEDYRLDREISDATLTYGPIGFAAGGYYCLMTGWVFNGTEEYVEAMQCYLC